MTPEPSSLDATTFYSILDSFIIPSSASARVGPADSVKTYRGVAAREYGIESTARYSLSERLAASTGLMYTRGLDYSDGFDCPT